uniref:Alpha-1,6-mannosyl-glycoprotein 2-beta-N-acetylglucosaminyltransferase n=1 Tax=Glossina pallidipes TaxID=7398 RepID=A0A1B0AGZ3_GLOPL
MISGVLRTGDVCWEELSLSSLLPSEPTFRFKAATRSTAGRSVSKIKNEALLSIRVKASWRSKTEKEATSGLHLRTIRNQCSGYQGVGVTAVFRVGSFLIGNCDSDDKINVIGVVLMQSMSVTTQGYHVDIPAMRSFITQKQNSRQIDRCNNKQGSQILPSRQIHKIELAYPIVETIYSTMRAVALPGPDFLTTKFRNDPRINHQIAKYNHLELVLNEDLFGPLDNDSVVIVVQIFYPYPIHTHPECQQNTEKKDNCNRAQYRYHDKRTNRAQMKNHWWWKANYIFDQLEIARYYSGLVLFLEEDNYVTKDFLYVLEMMYQRTDDLCPQCNIYTLGRHGQLTMSPEYDSEEYAEVEVMPWNVENNMAFAFNRTTWNNIRKCGKYFCSHADYNYDQSFDSTHMGPCKQYKLLPKVQNALRIADKSSDMFPSDLKLTGAWLNYSRRSYTLKGGWDTDADNELCMSMISPARRISPKRAKKSFIRHTTKQRKNNH